MSKIKMGNLVDLTKDFVPRQFMVDQKDNYYFRNLQSDEYHYRSLKSDEIQVLVKNNNFAENWDKVLVSDDFEPSLVHNCEFWGMVRIGDLSSKYLEHHKLRMPVGIYNCTIISCDLGNNVALRNVRYLSHYIIGDRCMLFNIDEMHTVDNAKFGNGIVKDGEPEDVRIWLEISNENGGRSILPFEGILPADAYIWSRMREDKKLLTRLKEMTDNLADTRRGYYGTVGDHTVIKNSRIIKDVKIGTNAYIKGANKLKNLTVSSSESEPTQIGEGVELVNGIVGYNNRIFYGVKAVRFVTGRNVELKYGARLLNSLIGPNSTISCCEVLNDLLFPFHEQHHNNSFLIAATVQGQSNIAAGATIGSNHNSRAADGEILADRGFWPGLESNFKHNSVFSVFTLVSKGSYHAELNITLPFSLVSPGPDDGSINIMPGFWFRYNMYALTRNSWKFENRDKRIIKRQNIEMDYLAPDSAEQMFNGLDMLRAAVSEKLGEAADDIRLREDNDLERIKNLEARGFINKGTAYIIKPVQGYRLYRMMLEYYGIRALIDLATSIQKQSKTKDFIPVIQKTQIQTESEWINIGGQLIPESELQQIIKSVKNKKIKSWNDLHEEYDRLWKAYPSTKRDHAIHCLMRLDGIKLSELSKKKFNHYAQKYLEISRQILAWTIESREKDYESPFRKMVYRNDDEMKAVLGSLEENSFIIEMQKRLKLSEKEVQKLIEHN